jgi:hypothetical protein
MRKKNSASLRPSGGISYCFICLLLYLGGSEAGFSLTVAGQKDTIVYFGTNGKLVNPGKAIARKEIHYKSPSKIEEITCKRSNKDWVRVNTELIKILKDSSFQIKSMNAGFTTGTIKRKFYKNEIGTYRFQDISNDKLSRDGNASSKIPLILHGEVKDYYENGNMRSKSQFTNNELISNQNWLEKGEKYIDTIYYSVDEEPMLSGGNFKLHQHVRQAFKDSGLDLFSVSGNLLLGFVVMETGEISGIRIIKSLGIQMDQIALAALKSLGGKWKPARLNGKSVRYYQLFPINFIYEENRFQSLEFDGSMIHYDKY